MESRLRHIIKGIIKECITEMRMIGEVWYHGSSDSREIEKMMGFTGKTKTITYISDLDGYNKWMDAMQSARDRGDMEKYYDMLDGVDKYKREYTFKTPLFLTDTSSVANTYANPKRAYDYQNATQRVFKVDVDCNTVAVIKADGGRFDSISVEKVRKGFIDGGVSEKEMDTALAMFISYYKGNQNDSVRTDEIAVLGNWFGFDCIDIVGVLDSYDNQKVKSTVRIVLDPTKARIK